MSGASADIGRFGAFWLALALILVWLAMPGTYFGALYIWTEFTSLAFASVVLVCAASGDKSSEKPITGTIRVTAIAVLCCALAFLTKVAMIALVVAFIVHCVRFNGRNSFAIIVLVVLPVAMWAYWRWDQFVGVSGYGTQLAASSARVGQPLFESLWVSLSALVVAIPMYVATWRLDTLWKLTLFVALLGCGLVGWWRRLRDWALDSIFMLLYLGLIVVWRWPGEVERFLMPAMPFLLFYVWLGVYVCISRLPTRMALRFLRAGFVVALLLVVVARPSLQNVERYKLAPINSSARWLPQFYGAGIGSALREVEFFETLTEGMKSLSEFVPKDACIFSIKPTLVRYHAQRRVLAPPAATVLPAEFERALKQCGYAYLVYFSSPSFPKQFYPMHRLADSVEILKTHSPPVHENTGEIYIAYLVKLR